MKKQPRIPANYLMRKIRCMRVAAEQRKGERRPKEARGLPRVSTGLGGSERPPKESGSHKIVGRDSWRPSSKTSNTTPLIQHPIYENAHIKATIHSYINVLVIYDSFQLF